MGFSATSHSSEQASFGNAVKLGATVGLVPGAILGIAYMSIPSVTTRAELLGTAALFVLFSSLFGVIVGGCIYLLTKSASLVWWGLNLLAGSAVSICILLESSVLTPASVIIFPLYLICREYLSRNLPRWISEAIDIVMVELIVVILFAGLFLLLDPLTGNSFSELVKPNLGNLSIVAEQLLTIFRNWLHR
jgi:hypothetical protein